VTALGIDYRDVSVHYPKRERKVEARLGSIEATAKNKTEARAEILKMVEQQAEHLFTRHYRVTKDGTIFVLYFALGWRYDIVRSGKHSGTTMLGALSGVDGEHDALASMQRHVDQWNGTEAA
jgi:hypothetical protein